MLMLLWQIPHRCMNRKAWSTSVASLQRSLASSMAADSSLMNAPSVMFDTNWKQMSLITKKKKKRKNNKRNHFRTHLEAVVCFCSFFIKLARGLPIQRVHLSYMVGLRHQHMTDPTLCKEDLRNKHTHLKKNNN